MGNFKKCITIGVKEFRWRLIMLEKQVTFRIDKKIHRLLEKEAQRQMRSLGSLIRLILTENITDHKEDKRGLT